jgi:hypothetical protein
VFLILGTSSTGKTSLIRNYLLPNIPHSVYVWAGSVGEVKKIGALSIPKQCWKVVHIKASNEWYAYLFENDQSKPDGINNNKVDLVDIEKLTGLKFK